MPENGLVSLSKLTNQKLMMGENVARFHWKRIRMRILILGAGGVGGYLGALLARAGHEVLFVDRWQEHVDAINRAGLEVSGQESFVARAKAVTRLPERGIQSDLLILATKTADTEEALTLVSDLKVEWVTSVQNALDVSEKLRSCFGERCVFGMITLVSGSLIGPGRIKGFKGDRATFLGEIEGHRTARIVELSRLLSAAGLIVIVPDQIESVRWTKMVWWIPLVVLPALTQMTFGEAFVQPDLAALYVQIERECASVASALGHPPANYPGMEVSRRLSLPFEAAVADVVEMGRRFVAEGAGGYKVAMLLDLRKRRRTEAAHSLGLMVREARKAGISVPYTDCVWRLVRAIESRFEEGGRCETRLVHDAGASA
jgi:2-dehydropantoate 2-reductase